MTSARRREGSLASDGGGEERHLSEVDDRGGGLLGARAAGMVVDDPTSWDEVGGREGFGGGERFWAQLEASGRVCEIIGNFRSKGFFLPERGTTKRAKRGLAESFGALAELLILLWVSCRTRQ
jgi:hypothetical protein